MDDGYSKLHYAFMLTQGPHRSAFGNKSQQTEHIHGSSYMLTGNKLLSDTVHG